MNRLLEEPDPRSLQSNFISLDLYYQPKGKVAGFAQDYRYSTEDAGLKYSVFFHFSSVIDVASGQVHIMWLR